MNCVIDERNVDYIYILDRESVRYPLRTLRISNFKTAHAKYVLNISEIFQSEFGRQEPTVLSETTSSAIDFLVEISGL